VAAIGGRPTEGRTVKTVTIFNPQGIGDGGFLSRDVSTLQVEKLTAEHVFQAMLDKKWHLTEGTYAALDEQEPDDFRALLLFDVVDATPKGPTWEVRSR
jgi:hypothetical protein